MFLKDTYLRTYQLQILRGDEQVAFTLRLSREVAGCRN